ncbi:signal peptidase II [Rhodobacter ferrooxidans]|uniref:Lipoprotein signal peptidase n=1 Tax=Rhodobacter ferrooxidans TaxID=371731 RepID=C8RXG5_9RHOB|nr:signal peptidase II [Rhodobacter sp. SW2]EEW26690.1 lipoprotein signal peptidase [Rhodobacter sp. SW2]
MRRVALIALLTFLLDQASKIAVVWGLNLAERGEIDVVPPYLSFHMAWNRGVNFGLGSSTGDLMRWVLVALALGISAWVWRWIAREGHGPWARASAGLLIGGALGNVVDRLAYGAVADFLNMSCCGIENPYAFNVADIAIFLGAVGLVLFTAESPKPRSGRRKTP